MRRDLSLYRDILLAVEACSEPHCDSVRGLPGVAHEAFAYHVKLLGQAGLLEVIDLSSHDGDDWLPESLTHEGHEFLDAIRSETVWAKAKHTVSASAGAVTLEALKVVVQSVLKELIGAS